MVSAAIHVSIIVSAFSAGKSRLDFHFISEKPVNNEPEEYIYVRIYVFIQVRAKLINEMVSMSLNFLVVFRTFSDDFLPWDLFIKPITYNGIK